MNETEIREFLTKTEALLEGHFLLSSGRHSDTYVQKQRVFQFPRLSASLADALVGRFGGHGAPAFDVVVSPALGAITFGYLVAYAADRRFVFAERHDGAMAIRRGQHIEPGERVLIVEDVVTTGGSAAEVVSIVGDAGGSVVGVGALVDRTNAPPPFRLTALLRVSARDWAPEDCPLCRDGVPIDSPGSRHGTQRTPK